MNPFEHRPSLVVLGVLCIGLAIAAHAGQGFGPLSVGLGMLVGVGLVAEGLFGPWRLDYPHLQLAVAAIFFLLTIGGAVVALLLFAGAIDSARGSNVGTAMICLFGAACSAVVLIRAKPAISIALATIRGEEPSQ